MINNLRYVTKKLKDHTLDETLHEKVPSEDRDSGTESDDEEPELCEYQAGGEMSSEVSSGCSVRSRPTSQTSTDTLTCDDLPMAGDIPDMPPPTSNACSYPSVIHVPHPNSLIMPSRRSRTPRNNQSTVAKTAELALESLSHRSICPLESCLNSPFMRECEICNPVEHHSSEEELETLTASWQREVGPEKRKWSQVARRSLTDSGSSDDEVSILTTGTQPPVQFRTTPPKELKPLRSVSPPSKMLSLSTSGNCIENNKSDGESPVEAGTLHADGIGRASSPRKRHRHTPKPPHINRPCLDFEKMQQIKDRAVTQWRNGGELSLSYC